MPYVVIISVVHREMARRRFMSYITWTLSRFVIFVSIIQSILLIGHWFLYQTLVRFFGVVNPGPLWSLRIALGLLSVSLVSSSLLAFGYFNLPVRLLYTTSVGWLGIFYLLIIASILSWMIYGGMKLAHFSIDRKLLVEILFGIAFLASVYGFINAGVIRTAEIKVRVPGLPPQWKGRTAVWVSDLHLGHVWNYGFSQKIAAMIRNLKPDIVFVGGDLYDGVAIDTEWAIEPFSRVAPPFGAYFITGNHEEFGDNAVYLNAVKRAGMKVLNNERVELEGLQIVGVDYRDSRKRDQFRDALRKMGIDRQRPSILLKHAPFDLDIAEEEGISFQISGHTHHGQVFLFRFITSKVYKGYDYGFKRWGDLLIYTSSGAGTWGPPMRVDTKPEIVLIKFE
jgi:predicted MPP superfamily phosphohydrolase